MPPDLLTLDPVPTLLSRVRAELAADFAPGRPIRVSRAPGRLDVMGGIADYTGSLVCEMPLDRAAAVALQRARRPAGAGVLVQPVRRAQAVHAARPAATRCARRPRRRLRREFDEPGRKWAAYLVGCLAVLHQRRLVDLADPRHAGAQPRAAQHRPPRRRRQLVGRGRGGDDDEPRRPLRRRPRRARRRSTSPRCARRSRTSVVGAPCGIMDQVDELLRRSRHAAADGLPAARTSPPLRLPDGVRVVGINSGVRHSVGGGAYGRTRCAAFMGHRIILDRMRQMGHAAGRELDRRPDERLPRQPRPRRLQALLPPAPAGVDDAAQTSSTATAPRSTPSRTWTPTTDYPVQHAVDHHVLEARRVRRFVEFLEQAGVDARRSPRARLRRSTAPGT